jgi:hypothetical protein
VSPIPEPYPNFLAVAEVTRRRPTALSTWLFVTPQGLRRSPEENPALQAVVMALEVRDAIGALTEKWRRLGHEIGFGYRARVCYAWHYRLRGMLRLCRHRDRF